MATLRVLAACGLAVLFCAGEPPAQDAPLEPRDPGGARPFTPAGWPAAAQHLSREGREAPVPPPASEAEAAFVALGAVALELEVVGFAAGGGELFRRRLRLEMDCSAAGAVHLVFPDGRVFSRVGDRVVARWGALERPDLREAAAAWLDGLGFLARLPHVAALQVPGRAVFLPDHGPAPAAGALSERAFRRGPETLRLRFDPATGAVQEVVHRPPHLALERRILLEGRVEVEGAVLPRTRTVVDPARGEPSLAVRVVEARRLGRAPVSAAPPPSVR